MKILSLQSCKKIENEKCKENQNLKITLCIYLHAILSPCLVGCLKTMVPFSVLEYPSRRSTDFSQSLRYFMKSSCSHYTKKHKYNSRSVVITTLRRVSSEEVYGFWKSLQEWIPCV